MPTTPSGKAIRPSGESKKSGDHDGSRRVQFEMRAALDDLHVGLGRVTTLADAALESLDGLPRPATATERKGIRRLEAFVHTTAISAREALDEADEAIDKLEGISLYHDPDNS